MKKYKVEFTLKVIEGHGEEYNPPTPASTTIKENVPEGESPIKLIASRLAQELKRIETKSNLEWEAEDREPVDVIKDLADPEF